MLNAFLYIVKSIAHPRIKVNEIFDKSAQKGYNIIINPSILDLGKDFAKNKGSKEMKEQVVHLDGRFLLDPLRVGRQTG